MACSDASGNRVGPGWNSGVLVPYSGTTYCVMNLAGVWAKGKSETRGGHILLVIRSVDLSLERRRAQATG